MSFRTNLRLAWCSIGFLALTPSYPQSKPIAAASAPASREDLYYSIEWRLINAGTAHLKLDPINGTGGKPDWRTQVRLESGGLVSKLYKVEDNYAAQLQDGFCTTSTDLNAMEGRKHRSTKVDYDYTRGKANYVERDLIKNAVSKTAEVDIPACASDIIGALYKLRTINIEPGQSTQLPMSDGKKSAPVRIEAQMREQVQTNAGAFKTIRYEAYVFNNVIYQRKGRLFVWLTDDGRKLPVQFQARMSFPIGSITVQLDKEEHTVSANEQRAVSGERSSNYENTHAE
jgi:uncharacterized protein DUF3108